MREKAQINFENALLAFNKMAAEKVITEALLSDKDLSPIEEIIVPVLERMGRSWEDGHLSLAQIYMGGRICEDLVDTLLPPAAQTRKRIPRMAIATLEDHHVLGKRIVYAAVRAAGYELIDYGHGIRAGDLVLRAVNDDIQILLLSTLMLPSALKVKEVRQKLDTVSAGTKIIVGGAPFLFDTHLWREVGADAMGQNGADAIRIIRKIAGGLK